MLTNLELFELLDERRKELKLSHMQLGKLAFGREDASALHNLKRGSSPTYERLAAIVEALGYEIYIGLPRDSYLASERTVEERIAVRAPLLGGGWHKVRWHWRMGRKGSAPIAWEAEWLETLFNDEDKLARLCAVESDGTLALILEDRMDCNPVRPDLWAVYKDGCLSYERMQVEHEAIVMFPKDSDRVEVYTGKNLAKVTPLGRIVWMQSPFFG